jgi:prepilin-type N-terminal cleavage/methylation domain-containing protein
MGFNRRPSNLFINDMDQRNGFSLVEVLIVVAIAASLVLVASNFSCYVRGLNTLISQQLQSKSDTSAILQIVTSEIRSAGPSQNGAYPIDSATTSSFAFYSDINKNGVVEHVRYFLASSSIYKGVIEPTGTPATYPTSTEVVTNIIGNVMVPSSTPLFSYYDSNYTGTQPPMTNPLVVSNIRLVEMSFYTTAATSPQSQPPQYFSTIIDIRNLTSN